MPWNCCSNYSVFLSDSSWGRQGNKMYTEPIETTRSKKKHQPLRGIRLHHPSYMWYPTTPYRGMFLWFAQELIVYNNQPRAVAWLWPTPLPHLGELGSNLVIDVGSLCNPYMEKLDTRKPWCRRSSAKNLVVYLHFRNPTNHLVFWHQMLGVTQNRIPLLVGGNNPRLKMCSSLVNVFFVSNEQIKASN